MSTMLYLNQLALICSLGYSHNAIVQNLYQGKSGLVFTDRYSVGQSLPLGCLPAEDSNYLCDLSLLNQLPHRERSRNNRLALAALLQIRHHVDEMIERFGADRIGVILGTSTTGIAEGEAAFREYHLHQRFPNTFHYGQQELGSPAMAIAQILGITGPAYVHSSACASSGKAMISAARLIKMGVCDAVITGGVDTLCAFTIAGFSALNSISAQQCNPLSVNRDGINIGEGAALFLMSKQPASIALCGWGESSDAYHFSAPDPAGVGAKMAITQSLAKAEIPATKIDYINLHGTATPQNDAMESQVVHALFGDKVPVSSSKPLAGHTLGAASAIEAGLCWLMMQDDNQQGLLLPHLWDNMIDNTLPRLQIVERNQQLGKSIQYALSNSFAFGGSNVALVLGRA